MYRIKSNAPKVSAAAAAAVPCASIETSTQRTAQSTSTNAAIHRSSILDYIACPKKFFHKHALRILRPLSLSNPSKNSPAPPQAIADVVLLQDSLEFRELCYTWDGVTVHKNTIRVRESDFEQAHVRTANIINHYFETPSQKPLLIHNPAIRALIQMPSSQSSATVELRSRPAMLHFYPKEREWRMYHPSAVTDPVGDRLRTEQLMQGLVYDMLVLQRWSQTCNLLSAAARAALTDIATSKDARASETGSFMDPFKSGVLTIRPYIAGPVTLQHHDTYTLSQFVQKTCLSEIATVATTSKRKTESADVDCSVLTSKSQTEWSLQQGIDIMWGHIYGAGEVLNGALDARKTQLMAALSSEGSPEHGRLLSSICNKCDCPLFKPGFCLPLESTSSSSTGGVDESIFSMPGMQLDKKIALWTADIKCISSALKNSIAEKNKGLVKLTTAQSRYVTNKLSNTVQVNPSAFDSWMQSIKYPAFFLDFESVQFALPPFEQCKPYQALPFQFSLDVFHHDVLTEEPVHYDFLFLEEPNCKSFEDPRGMCVTRLMDAIRAERLVARQSFEESRASSSGKDLNEIDVLETPVAESDRVKKKAKRILGEHTKATYKSANRQMTVHPWDGTFIAHFASFERRTLQHGSNVLPHYKSEIASMVFLDTIDLVKSCIAHPKANGSTSLKKLVPALLTKGEQYSAFQSVGGDIDDATSETADGSTAAALFRLWRHKGHAEMTLVDEMQAKRQAAEKLGWSSVRQQLLQYCNADTRNMWLVIRAIHKHIEASRAAGEACDSDGWSISGSSSSNSNRHNMTAAAPEPPKRETFAASTVEAKGVPLVKKTQRGRKPKHHK